MITGVHHACVIVSDMQKSLKFYRDLLGMKEIVNCKFDADPVMMDLPGTKPKQHIVMLSAGNSVVELIQYLEPKGQPSNQRPCDFANMHICFKVDDIQKAYQKALDIGINSFHREPLYTDAGIFKGTGFVYFRGPDNEILEFFQGPNYL